MTNNAVLPGVKVKVVLSSAKDIVEQVVRPSDGLPLLNLVLARAPFDS